MFGLVPVLQIQNGPPWYQRTLLLLLVLAGVVVVLGIAVMYLWYTRSSTSGFEFGVSSREQTKTDEECVEEILADAGGELPQRQLVEETDWSESKVSRVTSRLADDDLIEKIRIGRENHLRLADSDHTDSSSSDGTGD